MFAWKKIIFVFFILITIGCAQEQLVLKGSDGETIPPAYASFSGLPIPEPAYIDLEETRALGYGENWSGTLVYTAPFPAHEIFDFYIAEMPKFGWSDVATVRARICHMTYIRDKKAVQILIEKNSDSESYVTITSIPNNTGISHLK